MEGSFVDEQANTADAGGDREVKMETEEAFWWLGRMFRVEMSGPAHQDWSVMSGMMSFNRRLRHAAARVACVEGVEEGEMV